MSDKECYICGKETQSDNLCEGCLVVLKALYSGYTTAQLMRMFSHVLGVKVVEDITDRVKQDFETAYWSEYTKNLDKKDLQ